MLPASNRGAGMNLGFPDVCGTPVGPVVVPIPYPNIAMNAQAFPFSPNVKISMMNGLNMASKIPMTSGDEAGTAHPMIKMASAYTMGNPIVKINNMPAINLTCPTTGNNMNCMLGAVLVPSAVNVTYTQRRPEADAWLRAMTASDLEALALSLSDPAAAPRGAMLPQGIGCIDADLFTPDLSTRVYNEVARLEREGMRALILDLRDNPGGELSALLALADDFLPLDAEIVRLEDGDGDETVFAAKQGNPYTFPLIVLVNGGTASAAELFAGSMQANRRALVVGETTYGKGTVQKVVSAAGGAGVVYATVSSSARDGVGVEPDWHVVGEGSTSGLLAADGQLHAAWTLALEML